MIISYSCPVQTTMSAIEGKWKILIIRELLYGKKRYGEIKKNIGDVSAKMLTQSLREMEEDGLIQRTSYPEVPPRVEYELTVLGDSLKPIIMAMKEWGQYYIENYS